jgi:hypothetical protein
MYRSISPYTISSIHKKTNLRIITGREWIRSKKKKNFSVGDNILKLVAQNLILQIGDKT